MRAERPDSISALRKSARAFSPGTAWPVDGAAAGRHLRRSLALWLAVTSLVSHTNTRFSGKLDSRWRSAPTPATAVMPDRLSELIPPRPNILTPRGMEKKLSHPSGG